MSSLITVCSSIYLVSLRMEILLSNVALVKIRLTVFPLARTPHMYRRVWAVIQTIGISACSSETISSFSSLVAVTDWSFFLTIDSSHLPTSLVLVHSKKQCVRSAVAGVGQILQFSDVFLRILDSLASVGSRECNNFQRKLVASEPRRLSLASLQLVSQSVVGEASSALDLMYSGWLVLSSSIVISRSTSTLYHFEVPHLMECFPSLS